MAKGLPVGFFGGGGSATDKPTIFYNISTNDGGTLDGTTLTVNGTAYELNGSSDTVTIETVSGTTYTATLSEKAEYITPEIKPYTADVSTPIKIVNASYTYNRAYVDVNLSCNKGFDIKGAVVTVNEEQQTWNGTTLRFKLMPETSYTVSVSAVDGTIKPENKQGMTGKAGTTATVDMAYVVDIAYIDVSVSSADKATIDIPVMIDVFETSTPENKQSKEFTGTNPIRFDVKTNTEYTVETKTVWTGGNLPKTSKITIATPEEVKTTDLIYTQFERPTYEPKSGAIIQDNGDSTETMTITTSGELIVKQDMQADIEICGAGGAGGAGGDGGAGYGGGAFGGGGGGGQGGDGHDAIPIVKAGSQLQKKNYKITIGAAGTGSATETPWGNCSGGEQGGSGGKGGRGGSPGERGHDGTDNGHGGGGGGGDYYGGRDYAGGSGGSPDGNSGHEAFYGWNNNSQREEWQGGSGGKGGGKKGGSGGKGGGNLSGAQYGKNGGTGEPNPHSGYVKITWKI